MDEPTLPDPTAATRSLLMLDEDLRALVQDNVFCQEMPPDIATAVPQNAVLVQDVTGVPGFMGYNQLHEPSYNIFCMGVTPEMAKKIYLRVYQILKQARRQVVEGCLLHSYDQIGAPKHTRDPQTKWPHSLSVWKSLASAVQAV